MAQIFSLKCQAVPRKTKPRQEYDPKLFLKLADQGRMHFTESFLAFQDEDFTKCGILLMQIQELVDLLRVQMAIAARMT